MALDLATVTGWAASIAGKMTSGSVSFPVKTGEHRGWRFVRFNHWLYSSWSFQQRANPRIDLVVYVKMQALQGELL